MPSDAELVAAVLGGDRSSFAALVGRHERAVLGAALGVLRDYHAAEDAAQDAFVAAYQKLGSLRDGSRFAAWIIGIARRRAIDARRKRSAMRGDSAPFDRIAANCETPLDSRSGDLLRAIDRLPRRQRQVILQRFCNGLGVQEIAQATGWPVGTVTKYLSRAYARLRNSLRESNT
jgi:RNA polymerase sigma-70 factor, ECF subfamily